MSDMPDTEKWLLPLVAAGICAAGMAVLVAGIALALGMTGHDWYAAWKFTLVEAMLTFGFSDYGLVEYRTADGETVTVKRHQLAYVLHEAWQARRRIFSLAGNRALLGACAGLALFALWLVVRMALRLRRLESERGTAVEPARRSGRLGVLLVSPDEVERLAGGGVNATGESATRRDSLPPARTPGLSPPESAEPAVGAAVPAKPTPADSGSRPDTTKTDKPAGDRAIGRGREPGEQFF